MPSSRPEYQTAKWKFSVLKYVYQTSNIELRGYSIKSLALVNKNSRLQRSCQSWFIFFFQERSRQILIDHSTEVALTLQNNIFKITGYFMFEEKKLLEIRLFIDSFSFKVSWPRKRRVLPLRVEWNSDWKGRGTLEHVNLIPFYKWN